MGISSDDVFRAHGQIRTDQDGLCLFIFNKDKPQRLVQLLAPQVCPGKKTYFLFRAVYLQMCLLKKGGIG